MAFGSYKRHAELMRFFLPGHFAWPPYPFAFYFQLKRVGNAFRVDESEAGTALRDIGKRAHDRRFVAVSINESSLAVARRADMFAIFQQSLVSRSSCFSRVKMRSPTAPRMPAGSLRFTSGLAALG